MKEKGEAVKKFICTLRNHTATTSAAVAFQMEIKPIPEGLGDFNSTLCAKL
jgi:hypothetical protein